MDRLYTDAQVNDAFHVWKNEPPFLKTGKTNIKKTILWHLYCDIRDNLPLGTTQTKNGILAQGARRFATNQLPA
jgi:hypothetical protein